jgi:nucleolar protein 6
VEYSAGGGGNTENRKQKIKTKNDKLNEDRKRYAERKKEYEEAAKKAKEQGHGDIHPSRMGLLSV